MVTEPFFQVIVLTACYSDGVVRVHKISGQAIVSVPIVSLDEEAIKIDVYAALRRVVSKGQPFVVVTEGEGAEMLRHPPKYNTCPPLAHRSLPNHYCIIA